MPKLKTMEVWVCENCGKHLVSEESVCACQPKTIEEKLAYCKGCYNEDYNRGLGGAKQCWNAEDMTVVQRKRVHINDVPPWTHQPVSLLPVCYRVPKFVFVGANCTY